MQLCYLGHASRLFQNNPVNQELTKIMQVINSNILQTFLSLRQNLVQWYLRWHTGSVPEPLLRMRTTKPRKILGLLHTYPEGYVTGGEHNQRYHCRGNHYMGCRLSFFHFAVVITSSSTYHCPSFPPFPFPLSMSAKKQNKKAIGSHPLQKSSKKLLFFKKHIQSPSPGL